MEYRLEPKVFCKVFFGDYGGDPTPLVSVRLSIVRTYIFLGDY